MWMIVIKESNVDYAYEKLLQLALTSSEEIEESRVAPAKDLGLVAVTLEGSGDRLIGCPVRALNPFLAIVEAAWVLSGRNDLQPLTRVMKRYAQYSDDAKTLNGAYGFRLRKQLNKDQLEECAKLLSRAPNSRRAYLSIANANDVGAESLDIPCNVGIAFRVRRSKLDMTVINRSNDIYLGVPYDWFVFGTIHKYVADSANIQIGSQTHISNSMHLYQQNIEQAQRALDNDHSRNESTDLSGIRAAVVADFEAIADFDVDRITTPWLKEVLSLFLLYKKTKKNEVLFQMFEIAPLGPMVQNWATANRLT